MENSIIFQSNRGWINLTTIISVLVAMLVFGFLEPLIFGKKGRR